MRVDFYQLSQSPVDVALPQLAAKMVDSGARVLVVAGDPALRRRISDGLWAVKPHFLAHGEADEDHAARQPILLSDRLDTPNEATFLALADGVWRAGAERFARVFLLFDASTIDDARATWRRLGEEAGIERHYWRQRGPGQWDKAA